MREETPVTSTLETVEAARMKSSEESKVALHDEEEMATWQQGLGETRSGDQRSTRSGGRWLCWCYSRRGWGPDLVVVGPGVRCRGGTPAENRPYTMVSRLGLEFRVLVVIMSL